MWKRRKKQPSALREAAANKVATGIAKVQLRWGSYMNKRSAGWSPTRKRIFLVVFVVGSQFISLSLLLWDLTKDRPTHYELPTPMPAMMPPAGPRPPTGPNISAHDVRLIRHYKHMVDSMMLTPDGRDTLAAFNLRRPGFIDSVLLLEKRLSEMEIDK